MNLIKFSILLYFIVIYSRIKNKYIHELIKEIHYDKLHLILNNIIKNSFIHDVANA